MGTINFVLIGARNTGKTCYLALLASHCPGITTASDETTAYLKTQRHLLDAGELPQATASTLRELLFRSAGGLHKVDFSIDDYDGSFIESLSRSDTEDDTSRNTLKERIQDSEGLLFFMPYERHHNEEALSNFEDEINTIISLIEEITEGKYLSLQIPVAICITKWDKSPAYKLDHEIDAAVAYINDIPCYQRAFAKINKLFKQVSVHPISAFGLTEDGAHPIKGKINPYHLEDPLDFCLEKTFHRYDERIKAFQDNHDETGLFDYLCDLYDDLKHHREGECCQIYDELEQKISVQMLETINSDKQTILNNEQITLYENIRQESVRAEINNALESYASNKKKKKMLVSTLVISMIIAGGLGIPYYTQGSDEREAFATLSDTIKNKEIPMAETLRKVSLFEHKWQGLFKTSRFSQDRKQITIAMNDEIRERLKIMVDASRKSQAPSTEIIQKIKQFKASIEAWTDTDLVQTADVQLQLVLDSYHMLEALRKAHDKATTMPLDQFGKLKINVNHAPIQWNEFEVLLKNMHQTIATHVKAEAKLALANHDVRDLDMSAEDLEILSSEGDTEAAQLLKDKIRPALHLAKRQQQLDTMLGNIEDEREPNELIKMVQDNWLPDYTDSDKERIKSLLQTKFSSYETQELPALRPLNSEDQVKAIRVKLQKISDATREGMTIEGETKTFEFRYLRPQNLTHAIKKWESKLGRYKRSLDGIHARITFKGNGANDETDPLGFNCTANDHDLEITIDKRYKLPNDDDAHSACADNSLLWNMRVPLTIGTHTIDAIEHDYTVSNDEWQSQFELTETMIFQFANGQLVTIPLGAGTGYKIILSNR